MLTETVVSTILQASITGAGLIIAIYALITPIMDKIFKERVRLHRKKKKEFDKLKEKITSESSAEIFKKLKTLAKEIKEIKMFPRYLGFGVSFVFSSYILTVFCGLNWFIFESYRNFVHEFVVVNLFFFSTIAFFIVGMYAIFDVYRAMKGEYEQLKREREEIEKERKKLEKFTEEIEKRAKEIERRAKIVKEWKNL